MHRAPHKRILNCTWGSLQRLLHGFRMTNWQQPHALRPQAQRVAGRQLLVHLLDAIGYRCMAAPTCSPGWRLRVQAVQCEAPWALPHPGCQLQRSSRGPVLEVGLQRVQGAPRHICSTHSLLAEGSEFLV
jgi:hypothetical protein